VLYQKIGALFQHDIDVKSLQQRKVSTVLQQFLIFKQHFKSKIVTDNF
jgi:hypothetical protein